jgi:hypothetical protein
VSLPRYLQSLWERTCVLAASTQAPLAPHATWLSAAKHAREAAIGPSHLKGFIGQGALGLGPGDSGNPCHVNARIVPVPICDWGPARP